MKLAESERFPWDKDKILSRDHQQLADYLKSLIKKLDEVYWKISNVVNQNSDEVGVANYVIDNSDSFIFDSSNEFVRSKG